MAPTPGMVSSNAEGAVDAAHLKHKRRYCKHPDCNRIVKSQGLCQRHGAKVRKCIVEGCNKGAQGNFDKMCKAHFKQMKREQTPLPKVVPGKPPPPPEGKTVYEEVLPASIAFTSRRGTVMPLIAHLKNGFDSLKPPAWHRNEERRSRGMHPIENPATQLEGWERELVWMEILVLTGSPGSSFRHLARAWGRDKGFHMVLAQFICERQGDVQRKKRLPEKQAPTKKSRGPAKKRRRIKKNGEGVSTDTWDDDAAYSYPITDEALAADIFDFSAQEFESATALQRWRQMEETAANSDTASLASQRSAQAAATQAILGAGGGKIMPKAHAPVQHQEQHHHPEHRPETSALAAAATGDQYSGNAGQHHQHQPPHTGQYAANQGSQPHEQTQYQQHAQPQYQPQAQQHGHYEGHQQPPPQYHQQESGQQYVQQQQQQPQFAQQQQHSQVLQPQYAPTPHAQVQQAQYAPPPHAQAQPSQYAPAPHAQTQPQQPHYAPPPLAQSQPQQPHYAPAPSTEQYAHHQTQHPQYDGSQQNMGHVQHQAPQTSHPQPAPQHVEQTGHVQQHNPAHHQHVQGHESTHQPQHVQHTGEQPPYQQHYMQGSQESDQQHGQPHLQQHIQVASNEQQQYQAQPPQQQQQQIHQHVHQMDPQNHPQHQPDPHHHHGQNHQPEHPEQNPETSALPPELAHPQGHYQQHQQQPEQQQGGGY